MDIGLEVARSWRVREGGYSRDEFSSCCKADLEFLRLGCGGDTTWGAGEDDDGPGARGGPPNWEMNERTG